MELYSIFVSSHWYFIHQLYILWDNIPAEIFLLSYTFVKQNYYVFFFSYYSFCESDAFRAFGKVRITVLGKLLVYVYGNVVQGFSHESNHHPVMTLRLTIAFVFMQKLSSARPWQVTMRPNYKICNTMVSRKF